MKKRLSLTSHAKTYILLFFLACTAALQAQNVRTIKGRITDETTGEPLSGATIFIAPDQKQAENYKPKGVVSDYDGHYLFTLPQSVKKIVISYIGYHSITQEISGDKDIYDFRLKEKVKQLKDLVVTGYQKIEKRKLTSSVTTVNADDIKQVAVPAVDKMLSGQVAGVVVTPSGGAPGSQNSVRIRGTVSLSGSAEPLWVLDGIPLEGNDIPKNFSAQDDLDQLRNNSIAGLNPSDIQDITVLKDAAATAIYGARAANGVIVITSKKGQKGNININVSADYFYTASPDASRLRLLDGSQKVDLELQLLQNPLHAYRSGHGDVARIIEAAGLTEKYKQNGWNALTPEAQQSILALKNNHTDWFSQIYRPALNCRYGISLSGGNEKTKYYVSAGYYDEKGATIGTGFKRYNITSNTDFQITDKLTLSLKLFGNQNQNTSYLADGISNPQRYSRNVNPYRLLRDADGAYVYDADVTNSSDKNVPFNYEEERKNTSYTLNNQSLKSVFEVEYKVIKPLKLTTQLGLQIENIATEKWGARDSYYTRLYNLNAMYRNKYILPEGGIIQNWNEKFFQYNWKNQLFYNQTFDQKHDIDFMAGMELRKNQTINIHTKGFGFDERSLATKPIIFPEGFSGSNSAKFEQYNKRFFENAFVSFFTTASYTLMHKYTLFASLRYDGSNLFGVDPKYKYLPLWSVSGAWNVNRESFLKNIEWLDNLKIRASYGLQGNVDKNTSPFVKGEWKYTNFYGAGETPVIVVTTPPNKNLRWEKTKTINAGLDWAVLNHRISGTIDWYYRNSSDLLSVQSLPLENGFNFVNLNWGEVENKGWEISLSTVNIKTPDWTWSTNFNIAHNQSKVLKYNVRENSFMPSLQGYPVNAAFAIPTAGLDAEGNMRFKAKDGTTQSMKDFYDITQGVWGDYLSKKNYNEFRNLFVYIGDKDPKYTGGLSSTLRYKDLTLNVITNFYLSRIVQRQIPFLPTAIDPGVNQTQEIYDIWSPQNKQGTLPKILGGNAMNDNEQMIYQWINSQDPSQSYSLYDIWFKKISYWRFSSIRLSYTLRAEKLRQKWFKDITINAEAGNPFVISTSYKGYFDPESYGNIYAQPIAKTFSLGLKATF